MPYIEMTLEEAIRYVKAGLIDPNTKALVLTQNLERNEEDIPFRKKTKVETLEIIQNCKTFAKLEDGGCTNRLRAFSVPQNIHKPKRKGELNTILLKRKME